MAQQIQQSDAAPPEAARNSSVLHIIERAATDPNVDIDKMERLLQMQEKILAEQAHIAFHQAMNRAQEEMRPVVRDAENNQTHSRYTRLETIDRSIRPIYTRHGFSLSFGTGDCPYEGYIRVTCDVAHVDGHIDHKKVDMPLDTQGFKGNQNKTATHAHGSTMSYARRYLTLLIFNLAMADEDDDGNAAGGEPAVTETQSAQLKAKLEDCPETTRDWFAQTFGEADLVPRNAFDTTLAQLVEARRQSLIDTLAEQVNAAETPETLKEVWKDGLKTLKRYRERDLADDFRERVEARGKRLRAQEADDASD
ncbi:ERF family protein [Halomonas sp. NO4]|uniref:ERF family protein n=1 Tax=Halomonas sp. NO4 TaxID=2484813 RepID=UPI0013D68E80|nr:ERF family protein [Halomonas sp. NO4]